MKKLLRCSLLFVTGTLLLSACSSDTGSAAVETFNKRIVGYWYGEEKSKHLQIYWIYEYRPDNTFRLKTLEVDRGDTRITTVSGTWQYKNGVFTETVTRDNLGTSRSTGQPSRYKVKSLSADEFAYTELETGKSFVDRRVGPGFKLPVPKPRTVRKRKKRKQRKKKKPTPAAPPGTAPGTARTATGKNKKRVPKTPDKSGDDIEFIIRGLKTPEH